MSTLSAPARRVQVRKPRPKPARSIRLCIAPSPITAGVVRISVGQKAQDYLITELVGFEFGRGFLLSKIGHGEEYCVNVDANGKRSCECQRHITHGHCKHADGLAALVGAGRL